MNSYLLINVILTCAALTINHYMKIPHRIRFYILLTAVIAWLIPFTLISIELPRQTMALFPVQLNQLSEPILNNDPTGQSALSMVTVIYALLTLGLFRFLFDLFATLKQVQKLKTQSKPYLDQENIRLAQGINGAFVSGYLKPIIWLDEHLIQTDTLSSVITHEQQHIHSHDQFWLFIITLVQRLFWFNPLSLLLCHQCKNSIELSCDEACKKQLGHKQYQSHLAQLVIGQHHKTHPLMNNQIHRNKGFNIHRIEQLDQENMMTKFKTIQLSLMAIAVLAISIVSFTTVASNDKSTQLKDSEVLLGINWKITSYGDESSQSTELNSEIIVNDQEFKTFEFAAYEFKVKAQLSNPGKDPKTYFIYTQIAGDADFPVKEPIILVEIAKQGVIRIAESDSDIPVKTQIELAYTVLPDSQLAKISSDMNPMAAAAKINPIPALPELEPTPAKISAPESVPAVVEPHAPVTAPTPEKKDNDA